MNSTEFTSNALQNDVIDSIPEEMKFDVAVVEAALGTFLSRLRTTRKFQAEKIKKHGHNTPEIERELWLASIEVVTGFIRALPGVHAGLAAPLDRLYRALWGVHSQGVVSPALEPIMRNGKRRTESHERGRGYVAVAMFALLGTDEFRERPRDAARQLLKSYPDLWRVARGRPDGENDSVKRIEQTYYTVERVFRDAREPQTDRDEAVRTYTKLSRLLSRYCEEEPDQAGNIRIAASQAYACLAVDELMAMPISPA